MTTHVIYSDDTVLSMLSKLEKDFESPEVVLVERLPPVKEPERYRDYVLKILREFHRVCIFVRVVFRDGSRRGYAFQIYGEGELGELPEKGYVEGVMVEYGGDGTKRKVVYRPVGYTSSRELVEQLEKFAKLFHESELRVLEHKLDEAYREQLVLFWL